VNPPWLVVHHRGGAAALHALAPPVGQRVAWWLEADAPALALGSTQADDLADRDACAAAGVEVARRRSGGGAVLLIPGEVVWLDVVLPRTDPLWDDDIGRAMWWLGEVWAEALSDLGVRDVAVHRGALQQTAWSRWVCFDGLGAGEVTVGGRKAVGISQRRTREWCRLQSSAYLTWAAADPARLVALLSPSTSPPLPTADRLRPPAVVDFALHTVQRAVTTALHQR